MPAQPKPHAQNPPFTICATNFPLNPAKKWKNAVKLYHTVKLYYDKISQQLRVY